MRLSPVVGRQLPRGTPVADEGLSIFNLQFSIPLAALPFLPPNASAEGREIDALIVAIAIVTGIVFVAVEGGLIWVLVRYRRREGVAARYTHGNHRLELVWTLVPALILLILALASRSVWAGIKSGLYEDVAADRAAFQVEVEPQQFQWNVVYPGPDGKFGTPDDVAVINQLHLPVGRPILVRLRSKDVIHSFFLPEMRVKQDALPNSWARVRFRPIRELTGNIACAELCGMGHYTMRGTYVVESQAAVDAWVKEQGR